MKIVAPGTGYCLNVASTAASEGVSTDTVEATVHAILVAVNRVAMTKGGVGKD